jgi:hypothetical protein
MYEIFKENSKALRLIYSGNDTIKYHNNRQNLDKFIPAEEKVCYEILVNRTAYENMLNQENKPIKYKSKSTNDNDDLPF